MAATKPADHRKETAMYQPVEPVPAVTARKRRRWPWVVASVLGAFIVLVVIASVVTPQKTTTTSALSAAAPVTVYSTVTVYRTVTPAPAAPVTVYSTVTVEPTTTAAPGPATTISADGVYVVGNDIAAGTWHTSG